MPRLSARTCGWIATGTVALHIALAWLGREPGITGRDDARYALLARGLRESFSYQELWRNGAPQHAQYPPGFAAALAAWGGIAGERFDALILVNIIASAATIAIIFLTVRQRWSPQLGVLVALPMAVNPWLVQNAGLLTSEPLFMLLSAGALALLAPEAPRPGARVAAGALAIMAALTRSAGVPILPAVWGLWLLQKRWRDLAIFTAAAGVVMGAWFWWTLRHAQRVVGETYVGDAAAIVQQGSASAIGRIAARVARYFTERIPSALAVPSIPGTVIDNVITVPLLFACLVAGLFACWGRWRALTLYLATTACMLAVWVWAATRFVTPLHPLLVICVLAGASWLMDRWRPRWSFAAAAVIAAGLLVTGLLRTTSMLRQVARCDRATMPFEPPCVTVDRSSALAAALYVRDSLPRDAVVLFAKPELLAWYSGRRTLPLLPLLAGDSTRFVQRVTREGAGWILLGSVQGAEVYQLQHRLAPDCGALAVQAMFPPRTWLFRIRAEGEPADSIACAALETYRQANTGRDFRVDP